jgi:hypothetical protein
VARLQRFQRAVSWFGSKEGAYRKQLGALVPECIVAPPVPADDSPLTVWEHLADTLAPWGVTLPVELHHLPTSERWRIAARSALMAAGTDLGRPLLVAHPGAGARWKEAPSARFGPRAREHGGRRRLRGGSPPGSRRRKRRWKLSSPSSRPRRFVSSSLR